MLHCSYRDALPCGLCSDMREDHFRGFARSLEPAQRNEPVFGGAWARPVRFPAKFRPRLRVVAGDHPADALGLAGAGLRRDCAGAGRQQDRAAAAISVEAADLCLGSGRQRDIIHPAECACCGSGISRAIEAHGGEDGDQPGGQGCGRHILRLRVHEFWPIRTRALRRTSGEQGPNCQGWFSGSDMDHRPASLAPKGWIAGPQTSVTRRARHRTWPRGRRQGGNSIDSPACAPKWRTSSASR